MHRKEKKIIGWREYIDLPGWGIKNLKAKIDTGAKSSSLHVEDVRELTRNRISFYIILDKNKRSKKFIAPVERKGKVKSSIGMHTHRWFVKTKIKIGDIERTTKINLVSRREMSFRMLIGRTDIEKDFLVDATHTYVLGKTPSKKKKKKSKS